MSQSRGAAARCIAFAFVHAFDTVRGEVVLILPAGEASRAAALAETTVVVRGDLTWEPHSVKGQLVELGDDVLSPLQPYCSAWMLEGPIACIVWGLVSRY